MKPPQQPELGRLLRLLGTKNNFKDPHRGGPIDSPLHQRFVSRDEVSRRNEDLPYLETISFELLTTQVVVQL